MNWASIRAVIVSVIMLMAVTACGGGGGGTGTVPATSTSAVSTGVMVKGSVIVNGVRFEDTAANILIDDTPKTAANLKSFTGIREEDQPITHVTHEVDSSFARVVQSLSEQVEVSLDPLQAKYYQVSPIIHGVALFGVGMALSLFTGRNAFASGARMLALGAAAGAVTYANGSLVGVAVG